MLEGRAAIVAAVYADLADKLGRHRVLTGEDARKACGFSDKVQGGPLAVAMPANAEQVEAAVKIGRIRRAPVCPRLRLPALHADELRDVLVIDCGALQGPPIIDVGRRTVTAPVGCDAATVDRMARQARLCLRGVPAVSDGAKLGALLANGDGGQIGAAHGGLIDDWVGAEVVTGGGRLLQVGVGELLGQPSWFGGGLGQPLQQLAGSEGRLAVLCSVTLRLHPAPATCWLIGQAEAARPALLGAASAARQAVDAGCLDTAVIDESDGQMHAYLRAFAYDSALLPQNEARAQQIWQAHGWRLQAGAPEDRRVRLGLQPGEFPRRGEHSPSVDVRVAWPDMAAIADVTAALYAEAGAAPRRLWSFAADGVRLRCGLDVDADGSARWESHPLVQRAHWLFEAGAVPVTVGSLLRAPVRERMTTGAKVLLAALQRAWDPEGALAGKTGTL